MSLNYEILARDLTAPAVLSEGVQRCLGWFEICKILASKGGDCIQVRSSRFLQLGSFIFMLMLTISNFTDNRFSDH